MKTKLVCLIIVVTICSACDGSSPDSTDRWHRKSPTPSPSPTATVKPIPTPTATATPTPTATPTVTATPTATASATFTPTPTAGPTLPNGVFSLLTKTTVSIPPRVLENPNIKGIVIAASWCDVEPSEGHFDWSRIDALLAQVPPNWQIRFGIGASGLRCSQEDDVPEWAANKIPANEWIRYLDTNPYHPTYTPPPGDPPGTVQIPAQWSATWVQMKKALFTAAGARFSGDSRIKVVELPIFTGMNNDFAVPSGDAVDGILPVGSTVSSRMIAAGYTHAKMVAAGAVMFEVTSAWPNQVMAMPSNTIGISLESDPMSVVREVRNAARTKWGASRVIIVNYSISNKMPTAPPPSGGAVQLLYESAPYTAGQALWNVSGDTTYRMNGGKADDPIVIWKATIDKFVSYGTKGYFEFYLRDCTDPAMAPAIEYANTKLSSPTVMKAQPTSTPN